MSHVAHVPAVDPTLPKVSVTLDGTVHYLVFTFGALALAEAELRKQGVSVNMLQALDFDTLDATRFVPLLYAALITHDPAITPEKVAKLVTIRNYPALYQALGEAFIASLAEPDKDAEPAPLAQAE